MDPSAPAQATDPTAAQVDLDEARIGLSICRRVLEAPATLRVSDAVRGRLAASREAVDAIVRRDEVVYGVNTGFGLLASTRIGPDQLTALQRNLVLSHAVGTGPPLPEPVVRLVLVLKARSLSGGYSGVRPAIVDALGALLAADVLPVIPAQGSVGASGDLAPLAHLAAALLGVGEVRQAGETLPATDGLSRAGLAPLGDLRPKEGLALLNGTQVSTALAIWGLLGLEDAFAAATLAGAMSVDAARGSDVPFDPRIHAARGQPGQIRMAGLYRTLLDGSAIRESHRRGHEDVVQDPYSLRCQPQVMGACLDAMRHAARILTIEANAATDNPLVFPEDGAVLSGGNFHAEPVALAADLLAIAASEVGSLSERRTALLMDPHLSRLPAFLVREGGVNSGFMIAHVTAAALAAENQHLAHPAGVDSRPTSGNQEDHVSMATHAARRLGTMADNLTGIVAVELLAAAQGVDFHAPLETAPRLQEVHRAIRSRVDYWEADRFFAPDLAAARDLVAGGWCRRHLRVAFLDEPEDATGLDDDRPAS
jgi:histidine ammonia-lyase